MRTRLRDWVGAHGDELVSLRRQVHCRPELSWQERETTALVARRLEVAGLEPRLLDGGSGLVCDVGPERGTSGPGESGAVVALRAELDALPIEDTKEVPYRSIVPGVAHACGHDVHTAIVCGAGLALAALAASGGWPGPGVVRLVFQPAEEATPGGALTVVEAGALEGVEAIFGLHCDPRVEVGQVAVKAGPITSASDRVLIRLHGPGGHTARPYRTVDLVTVAAKVVTDLTLGMSRLTDTRGGANLTFGAIHAGHAPNVIPSEATLEGTFRAMDRATWDTSDALLARLLADCVHAYGANYELEHERGAPPVENDPALTDVVAKAAAALLGEECVLPAEQSLGGDDFAWYLEHVPGSYTRLGVRAPGTDEDGPARDLHTADFDVDERAIPIGVQLLTATALDALACFS